MRKFKYIILILCIISAGLQAVEIEVPWPGLKTPEDAQKICPSLCLKNNKVWLNLYGSGFRIDIARSFCECS